MSFVARNVSSPTNVLRRSDSANRRHPRVVSTIRPATAPRPSALGPELSARTSAIQAGVGSASLRNAGVSVRYPSAQRQAVVRVTSDYILKGSGFGAGQLKLATGESAVLGRDADDSDFVVKSPNVSSAHAKVTATKGGIQIKDLGSTNGTFIDGKKVGSATLKAGQTVVFGDKTFSVVEVAGASESAKVARGGSQMISRRGSQIIQKEAPEKKTGGGLFGSFGGGGTKRISANAKDSVADGKKQAQADAAMDRKAMAEAKKFAQQQAAAERKAQAQEAAADRKAAAEDKKQAQAQLCHCDWLTLLAPLL